MMQLDAKVLTYLNKIQNPLNPLIDDISHNTNILLEVLQEFSIT